MDISDEKIAAEALKESERLKGVLEMAGAVCHEMNQPLMALSGCSELLFLKIGKEDQVHRILNNIDKQVKRIRKINLNLMNIAHYKTKKYMEGQIIDIDKSTPSGVIIE